MKNIAFEDTLRQSRAYNLIRNDFKLGLGHAYMVVSPDDEIVTEFFALVGATIYCQTKSGCLECSECLKVLHGNHADVFRLNETGEKIKVQDVRDLTAAAHIRPLSDHKLFFIHRADLMSVDAQNKLLKTLEEPPAGVTIFLGVANEAAMLETIKSRSRTVYIDIFSQETVYRAMLDLGCDAELAQVAAACCEGQLGKARKIALSPSYTELYKDAITLLKGLQKSTDVIKFDTLPCFDKNMTEFLSVLSIVLRDILAAKENKELIFSGNLRHEIEALSEGFSARAVSEIIMRINAARRKLSLNVSALSVVDNLLFSILEVKYKWQ